MKLTDSTAAEVGTSDVSAILSSTSLFNQYMCYMAINVKAPSGAKGVIKEGIGGLQFLFGATYSGPTKINGGQIVITGPFVSTLNGVISGTGVLTKTGTATLTLGGNNTYSGGTIYAPTSASGTITFASGNAFGTGLFTAQGQCQIITGGNVTLPNNFQINTGTTLQYRTAGANTITLAGDIAGSGGINKTGNGFLDLQGTLSYTGVTQITAGTIRAYRTIGASTATANFTTSTNLGVSFNVPPASGTQTYRFFQGSTSRSYTSVTLTNAAGRTGTYNSSNSTLTIT